MGKENVEDKEMDIVDEDVNHERFSEDQLKDENIDWKAKALELDGLNQRRATKLAKARDQIKTLKDKPAPEIPPAGKKDENKTGELDLGQKSYLKSFLNVSDADELQLAKDIMTRAGVTVEQLTSDEYFLGKLESLRTAKAAAAALPGNRGRGGNGAANSAEYHFEQYTRTGVLPEDREMRKKVVSMRRDKERNGKMFTDEPVVGSGYGKRK